MFSRMPRQSGKRVVTFQNNNDNFCRYMSNGYEKKIYKHIYIYIIRIPIMNNMVYGFVHAK